ncbi:MAG: PD-(D/E)XK nuclease family protein [Anaerolineales bacterium]|nr:PD-(D/E)XK nuclease family protein [Anaerolineales bacterium]
MPILLGSPLTGKSSRLAEAYQAHLASGYTRDQIVCLSFFAANAAALRRALLPTVGGFLPWVTTLQRFQTLLLRRYARQARLPRPARELGARSRALLLRQAWAATDGPLWRAHGSAPAALAEFTRVVDWLSRQRAGFCVAPGELSSHELARAYGAYLGACDRHGLLTFQEAALRCLDLLTDPDVSTDVRRRFPVLLVDDVHLARPDQLRLIDRLRELAEHFTATAWLEPASAAPELEAAWQMVQRWQAVEPAPLTPLSTVPSVNPAILAVVQRVTRPAARVTVAAGEGAPVVLHSAVTVEAEAHAMAQAIVRALLADVTLRPAEIAVLAPDAGLLSVAARVLADYGLPVAPPRLAPCQTPLVRGALLALRWLRCPRQRSAIEADLLELPFVALDPLDRRALVRAAAASGSAPLSLPPARLTALSLSAASLERLEALRSGLAGLQRDRPPSILADEALSALDATTWLATDERFSAAERGDWERQFVEWRRPLRELEALLALGAPEPADWLDHLEALADQAGFPAASDGLQLVSGALVNGVRARWSFVLGLTENATPRQHPPFQLVPEPDLPSLFGGSGPVVLPLLRDQAAWIEREARGLAGLLSRGTERLWISCSRFALTGEAQLPSPFFERLLGSDGEIDQDGHLQLGRTALFEWAPLTEQDAPESRLAQLGAVEPQAGPSEPGARLLVERTFSASQVRVYLTCPLQFYYQRVLGLETEGSEVLDRGGLIHELLCVAAGDGTLRAVNLWDRPRPGWMKSPAALSERGLAALEAAWRGEACDLPGGGHYSPSRTWGEQFGPELQRQAVRRWAERVLASWAEYEVIGLPESASRRPVLLEASFRVDLDGYRLVGRIDRLDEIQTPSGPCYEVIDYKTGRGGEDSLKEHIARFLPPADTASADYQLPIYALALMRGGVAGIGQAPRALNLVFVETLDKTKRGGYSARACRTIHLVPSGEVDTKTGIVPVSVLTGEVSHGLRQTLNNMLASPYPPRPGRHCAYCSFQAACERGRSAREVA